MKKQLPIFTALALLSITSSQAALIISIDLLANGDASLTASGTLDTSSLTVVANNFQATIDQSELDAAAAEAGGGNTLFNLRNGDVLDVFVGFTSPSENFILSNTFYADSFTGDHSLAISYNTLFLETGTTSSTAISFTQYYDGTSKKPLELQAGTYEWAWASDKIVMTVTEVTSVPEPSSSLLIAGAGLGLVLRRKKI